VVDVGEDAQGVSPGCIGGSAFAGRETGVAEAGETGRIW
jgi:hypothetical protein